MKTTSLTKIHWADLNKGQLAFYTGKWFLLWTFKFFIIGLMAACTLLAFFLACTPKPKE